ncbi:uncharacterized protein si:dkey-229e3.2 isoform X2 [Neoarius graeffei]|uniref:uncharacterized protein si:dkey-229e3.2 isoform X2 n=1 Tax=Neoarius graeffei TaxID=443677 RepID=UPI00298CA433|nr:uncharacterized protein si:dkey-229e3.2 isoform X2 [Neoarius graeffei]
MRAVYLEKCECAAMENLSEDGLERCKEFGDWSTCSSEHWDEDHGDSSGFGDWTTFKEGLSEESDSVYLSSQEGQTSDHENKVERGDEPWVTIHDCFHVEEIARNTDMMDVLPLSQLLHNSTHTPAPPAVLLKKGVSFYHSLLCESKPLSIMGPKQNLYSYKQLTDTLQIKQSSTLQLTAPTWCQNSPGFLYQISHQWLNHYCLRL